MTAGGKSGHHPPRFGPVLAKTSYQAFLHLWLELLQAARATDCQRMHRIQFPRFITPEEYYRFVRLALVTYS